MLLKKEFVLSLREKQQHNIEFPTFKLPASTYHLLWPDLFNIICDVFGIRLLVVYFSHKGNIS